jgi:FAD synthase
MEKYLFRQILEVILYFEIFSQKPYGLHMTEIFISFLRDRKIFQNIYNFILCITADKLNAEKFTNSS